MNSERSSQGRRSGLLVSVRSPAEALEALAGGADWIDVKEPLRGPLGPADPNVCEAVRSVVPRSVPFSLALGELADWPTDRPLPAVARESHLVKIGLARAPQSWRSRWGQLRSPEVRWAAVAYADWRSVEAPDPAELLGWCLDHPDVSGLLIDTAEKSRPSRIEPETVAEFRDQLQAAGKFLAIAGGLDADGVAFWNERIGPDWVAVRTAACRNGDRLGPVTADRVRALADRLRVPSSRNRNQSESARTTSGA